MKDKKVKTMDTLLEKMNNKETNNTILLKKKIITLLKNQEVINLFKKAKDFDSAYTISATTDKYNIYLTTDTNHLGYPNKGDFWLKVIDRKKIIPFNNVLLEAYIDTSLFRVKIEKYISLKLDPETAFDCFKKVIGFEDKMI
jgi:hypothetical protein